MRSECGGVNMKVILTRVSANVRAELLNLAPTTAVNISEIEKKSLITQLSASILTLHLAHKYVLLFCSMKYLSSITLDLCNKYYI